MELKKISKKLNDLIKKSETNKNRTMDQLKEIQDRTSLIDKELDESMMIGDEEKTSKLVLEKRTLEEKIRFFQDYLDKYSKAPLITKKDADDLFIELSKSIKEELNKNYDKVLNDYRQALNDAEKLLNVCIQSNELASKINYARKTTEYTFVDDKASVLKDIYNTNYSLRNRRHI